ncbi:MAG: acyl-CoA dehydrogenase family protein [Polyangiaceae bacterium]|nr:acyl-CoA dehydrogenase family protein [Polyangiaceae bacterium]
MRAQHDLFTPLLQSAPQIICRLRTIGRNDDEQTALDAILREVQRFGRKHVDGAAIDRRGALGPELLGAIAERGWFGLTIPEAHGGAGLSLSAATRVVSELCFFNGSLGTCVGLHSGLALFGLIHLASPELQARYLPEIAAGERIAAFAATEPNAGSDIGAMRTLLAEHDGKLLLRGSKCYVTNGGFANVLTVVASSPGMGGARSGHTIVVVDPSWPGVTRQGEEHKLGLKGSSTITIDFDDVQIPRDHVVGELGKGLELAHRALTWGRTFMAAGCLGSARAAYAEARSHTAQRVQFGRSLDKFPLVREQLAGCAADVCAVESVIYLVCDIFDAHAGDIALDSTVAKIAASELTWNVIDRGLQLMGGAGVIEEYGMARRLRDVRVTRIFEGANDVLRLHLASATLGWPRKGLVEFPALAPHVPLALREAAADFDAMLAQVGPAVGDVQKKYGFKLFERQPLQAWMADMLIPTYASLAVLLRAAGRVRDDDTPATSPELATALIAVSRLTVEARRALAQVRAGANDQALALADAALA